MKQSLWLSIGDRAHTRNEKVKIYAGVKLHNHRFYSSALIETTPPNLDVLKVFYYSLLC